MNIGLCDLPTNGLFTVPRVGHVCHHCRRIAHWVCDEGVLGDALARFLGDFRRHIEKAHAVHMDTSCRVGNVNRSCGACNKPVQQEGHGEDGESTRSLANGLVQVLDTDAFERGSHAAHPGVLKPRLVLVLGYCLPKESPSSTRRASGYQDCNTSPHHTLSHY